MSGDKQAGGYSSFSPPSMFLSLYPSAPQGRMGINIEDRPTNRPIALILNSERARDLADDRILSFLFLF